MRVTSVIIDRKLVNSIGRIYFPVKTHFEMLCFEMGHQRLVGAVRKAYKFIMKEYGIIPHTVFIPFYDYSYHMMETDVTKGDTSIITACHELGLDMVILTPDELRSMIAPLLNIDKEI